MPVQFLTRGRTPGKWSRPGGRITNEWRSVHWSGRWGLFTLAAKRGWGVSIYQVTHEGTAIRWDDRFTWLGDVTLMKKKTKAAAVADSPHLAAMESNLFAAHLGLVAHCAVTRYDDGDPRKPGWLTIKTLGSAWQVEAKDPDTCCTLRVVQANLDDALGLLNLLLESEEAPWEPDMWLQQQAAKTRKKG